MKIELETPINIESKEFWEQVKKDYQKGSSAYICNCSNIFKKVWSNEAYWRKIINYAERFNPYIKTGTMFLFKSLEDDITPRRQFIDYMVKKFS